MQLLDIIDQEKPKSICEVGTWNGNNAIRMIQAAAKYHPMKRISYQGFDLFEEQTGEQFVRELSKIGQPNNVVEARLNATGANIELIAGDTLDTITEMEKADLIFVDGGHSEETIANDGGMALEMGKVVVFDDYYHAGKPDGMGCNLFIDALAPDMYKVTHLPARTHASDGREIGMVKVQYANV
jgi:predicted O-methyltransferase YrrM